jgi:hypothetical protein
MVFFIRHSPRESQLKRQSPRESQRNAVAAPCALVRAYHILFILRNMRLSCSCFIRHAPKQISYFKKRVFVYKVFYFSFMRPVSSFPSASQGKGPNVTTCRVRITHHVPCLWRVLGAPHQDRSTIHGAVGAHRALRAVGRGTARDTNAVRGYFRALPLRDRGEGGN